jgi:lipoate-protein ligase A
MADAWHLLQSPPGAAAWNMAVDDALLQTAPSRGRALLRVYSWTLPAISFGYFQKVPAAQATGHVLVRRPTGGGVVYHGADTTYTVIVPVGHPLHALSTHDAYCAIHRAVASALAANAALHTAPVRSPAGSYECFQRPVHGDVVAAGQKLAGGAQRRTKTGMLHQGSIAAAVPVAQLCRGFTESLGVVFEPYELSPAERELAARLTAEKYDTPAWNYRIR